MASASPLSPSRFPERRGRCAYNTEGVPERHRAAMSATTRDRLTGNEPRALDGPAHVTGA